MAAHRTTERVCSAGRRRCTKPYDTTTSQYHLYSFLPSQPDLNWWSEDVRREFDETLQACDFGRDG
jgi:hypothetical protein